MALTRILCILLLAAAARPGLSSPVSRGDDAGVEPSFPRVADEDDGKTTQEAGESGKIDEEIVEELVEELGDRDLEPPTSTIGMPVIVRVDRHTDVRGYVELEDDDVVVLRNLDGKLESFAKSRVLRIIHLVDPGDGQLGVVFLRNGGAREGTIIEDTFDHVLMEIVGVRAKLKRESVDYVLLEPSVMDRYERYRAGLKPEMALRHLALCEWLVEVKEYELANEELVNLLANHRTMEGAKRLHTLVKAQLALARKPAASRPPGTDRDGNRKDRDRPTRLRDLALPEEILTHDDVNLIRVYEIDFTRPPKIAVPRSTIQRLIETYRTDPTIPIEADERDRLFRSDPLDVVENFIFKLRARELYGEIDVLTEPYALNLFRQRVHNAWLMNHCATSRCHGGLEGGRLFLHRRNYKDARVRYTNLLILERLELDPGWPLVNYDNPLDSLIIQYGLPRTRARKPHPAVPGWTPAFRQADDRGVRATVQWIQAMLQPRADYPVEYEPPVLDKSVGEAIRSPIPDRTGR